MATTKTIIITGDEEVQARLKMMGATAQVKLQLAIMSGLMVVQSDAKARAPYRTGNLMRSIHMEQLPGGTGGVVGTNVEYAAAQEYGRPDINLPARPYLRPAIDQNLGRVATIIAATFGKLIQL